MSIPKSAISEANVHISKLVHDNAEQAATISELEGLLTEAREELRRMRLITAAKNSEVLELRAKAQVYEEVLKARPALEHILGVCQSVEASEMRVSSSSAQALRSASTPTAPGAASAAPSNPFTATTSATPSAPRLAPSSSHLARSATSNGPK